MWPTSSGAFLAPRTPAKPFYPGHHKLAAFRTPEYSWPREPVDFVWETTRGMGSGFGYNSQETEAHRISPDDLVMMYRDVRTAGGNMLLNVGPLADGSISDAESARLRHLGEALSADVG